jgi:hypothetical protein
MKSKPIKSTKSKTTTNPETVISIEQDMLDLKIQAIDLEIQTNELQNKLLKKQRKLLDFRESDSSGEIVFRDFPDD